jgi:serine/threonine-protein kinase
VSDTSVPVSAALRLNEICNRFEAAWRCGEPRPVEEFLDGASGEEHAALERELVLLDVHYRRQAGQTPRAEDYSDRFPDLGATWLAEAVGGVEISEVTTVLDGGGATAGADLPPLAGHELLGEVGHGGMGVVYRARDARLSRDLALKVLREEYRGRPDVIARFLDEAHIAGGLQHPGIVPVHALGRLPDGRPCFTMKLVQGRTLADLLAGRADPTQGLPHFLGIFEQVCQAVAYAHSQGVIHRDLKPGNVMVGAFGEVQVMDWGLAKVLAGQASRERERPEAGPTVREDGARTQAGVVLGTPAYMAPEQARGEVEQLDERSDVFALGAMLCEILTGEAAYRGEQVRDVLREAAGAELSDARARLDGCGADAELVALAKRCLAAEPGGRPDDAASAARELTAYLEGVRERLRATELERAAAQARVAEARATAAAERRARRRTVALAVAVLLLFAGLGGGAWWVQQVRQQRRAQELAAAQAQREADDKVAGALVECQYLLEEARSATLVADLDKFAEALPAARAADELARARGASENLRQQAASLADQLAAEVDATGRDRRLLTALLEVRAPREGVRYRQDAQGFLVVLAEPTTEEQFQAAFRAWDPNFDVDLLPTEVAAARLKRRPPAVVTEVIAALDEWASERRRQGMPVAKWQSLALLATALDDDPGSRRREVRAILTRGNLSRERALGALGLALRPVPVPFDAGLGEDRARLRRLVKEIDVAREPVLELLKLPQALRVAGDEPAAEWLLEAAVRARPREVMLHYALGKLFEEQRRWGEAVRCYTAARALRPELGEALAWALVRTGGVSVDKGLSMYEQLVNERKNPWLQGIRGNALSGLGRYPEAEAAYHEAIRLKPDFAEAHNNLGIVLVDQRRYPEAEAAYREAIRLRPDFPETRVNLGNVLVDQRRYPEAEAAYHEAIRLRPDFPNGHGNFGVFLNQQGRYKEAEAALREALRLQPDYPEAHSNLACALGEQGRYKEAEAECHEALRVRPDFPGAYNNLGITLKAQRRYPEAESAYREALRLGPDFAEAHVNLGVILCDVHHRYPEAEAEFHEALRLQPDSPEAHSYLAAALGAQGRLKEAEAECHEAIRLRSDLPVAHYSLGKALSGQARYPEAEAAFRRALRLRPDVAEAHCELSVTLEKQGRFAEALESLRQGHTLGSKVPGWPYPSAEWVRQCERLVELDRNLPDVLRGSADPAGAAERIEFASLCRQYKGLSVSATRLYADAFADPQLAPSLRDRHRYGAACSAAPAAAGQGEDAKALPDKVVVMLRRQALQWLRTDLARHARMAGREEPAVRRAVHKQLTHWQRDTDLASVRDAAALAKLPEAEREAWRQLWTDVAVLLGKTGPEK